MHQALKLLFLLGSWPLVSCSLDLEKGAERGGRTAKSSVIPAKREFPTSSTVSPCDNFYEYACRPVIESFQLREDRSRHSFAFDDSSERILDYKKNYFAKLANLDASTTDEKELKNIYLACMNKEGRSGDEKELITEVKGIVEKISTREQFQEKIESNVYKPYFSFVKMESTNNLDRPDWNDAALDTNLMALPERSYYENKDLMADYQKLVVKFFETIGVGQAQERANGVIEFEKALSKVYPLPAEWRVILSEKKYTTPVKDIKSYPALKLKSIYSKIPAKTMLRDFIPGSLKYLNDYLASATLEQLKSLYLYFSLKDYLDDSNPEYFQTAFDFQHKYLGGPPVRPVREERCTKYVMRAFSKELDFILLPKLFPDFPEKDFVAMAEKVRGALTTSIQKNKWLSASAKAMAATKMQKAKLMLVKPSRLQDWDFNPKAEYSPERPIKNTLTLQQNLILKRLKEFSEPINQQKWHMAPLTINAYYDPSANTFVLPVGILQYPFYDPIASEAANLGAVGAVIGHELGHGIDDEGSKFDQNGRLKRWMTPGDLAEFKKRGARMIDQFNKVGHNGVFTLGENIGDLVGLSMAYSAAFGDKTKFVGMPLEQQLKLKQEFFLSWGRSWCEVQLPKYRENRLKTDPHALGEFRVNEQVKHQRGFAEAYQCKPKSPMTLTDAERVSIW